MMGKIDKEARRLSELLHGVEGCHVGIASSFRGEDDDERDYILYVYCQNKTARSNAIAVLKDDLRMYSEPVWFGRTLLEVVGRPIPARTIPRRRRKPPEAEPVLSSWPKPPHHNEDD